MQSILAILLGVLHLALAKDSRDDAVLGAFYMMTSDGINGPSIEASQVSFALI